MLISLLSENIIINGHQTGRVWGRSHSRDTRSISLSTQAVRARCVNRQHCLTLVYRVLGRYFWSRSVQFSDTSRQFCAEFLIWKSKISEMKDETYQPKTGQKQTFSILTIQLKLLSNQTPPFYFHSMCGKNWFGLWFHAFVASQFFVFISINILLTHDEKKASF